jgi:hypothetical protein
MAYAGTDTSGLSHKGVDHLCRPQQYDPIFCMDGISSELIQHSHIELSTSSRAGDKVYARDTHRKGELPDLINIAWIPDLTFVRLYHGLS